MVSFVDKFADVYAKDTRRKTTTRAKVKRSERTTLTEIQYIPKDAAKYAIYADQLDTYQADLMFEPYVNLKKERKSTSYPSAH